MIDPWVGRLIAQTLARIGIIPAELDLESSRTVKGAYVLAPSQIGGSPGQPAFGRSTIVDP